MHPARRTVSDSTKANHMQVKDDNHDDQSQGFPFKLHENQSSTLMQHLQFTGRQQPCLQTLPCESHDERLQLTSQVIPHTGTSFQLHCSFIAEFGSLILPELTVGWMV